MDKLPVFVWIHGGAFLGGSGSSELYLGNRLAQNGIIVVTINYRMSILGFFSHPSFGRHGNFGILDQAMALSWVKENIEAFGGDPEKITVGGQSAGSLSIGFLINSPYAANLFSKAIMESGPMYGRLLPFVGKNEMDAIGVRFVEEYLNKKTEDLYALPATELTRRGNLFMKEQSKGLCWTPVIDGDVVSDELQNVFEKAKKGVPVLAGVTQDEFISDYSPSQIKEGISERAYEELAEAFKKSNVFKRRDHANLSDQYPYPGKEDSLYQYSRLQAAGMLENLKDMAVLNREKGEDTYLYQFCKHTSDPEDLYHAPHSAELPYLFGNVNHGGMFPWFESTWKEEDYRMSETIQKLWSSFVKGEPMVLLDGTKWLPYEEEKDNVLILR